MIREFVVSSAMGKPILAYRSSMEGEPRRSCLT